MRKLLLPFVVLSVSWTGHLVQGQIAIGCFQSQPDSNIGSDSKSFQDIFMSQGACTNFCKSNGSAYALTSDGSICRCSNSPPLDSNKVDDSKCDKPCVGYPFEMCGGSSSQGLANVLLIGSTANIPTANNNSGSSSTSTSTSSTASPSPESSANDAKSKSSSDIVNGGKALNSNSPGMLPPPGPTATSVPEIREKTKWREKENGQNATSSNPIVEDVPNTNSGGTKAGAVAASIMAVFGFSILFVVALLFNKRRRQRLARAAWTENMLLPSSLIHTSNDDELEGQDYTRATPIYHNGNASQQGPIPPSAGMHFPPPPVLHPRQSGALHMHQPSYPPPMMTSHYNNMRSSYQPFPIPPMLAQQHQYEHSNINHKEPLSSSPPPFTRAPHSLQQHPPMDEEEERHERTLSHPSVRSIRHDRRETAQRGSVDSCASGLRDDGYYGPDLQGR
ncbi:hypothetical protein EDD21DRAFT_437891 [Dissophora ornata]|nr:hypothetical protein EDD21DRAFT_437891 [Dissophora ornata]